MRDNLSQNVGGEDVQDYSVISLPQNTEIHRIKAADSTKLEERYGNLLKKFDGFSEDEYELEQMLANQSQLILIYNNIMTSEIAIFVFDYCQVVTKNKFI